MSGRHFHGGDIASLHQAAGFLSHAATTIPDGQALHEVTDALALVNQAIARLHKLQMLQIEAARREAAGRDANPFVFVESA